MLKTAAWILLLLAPASVAAQTGKSPEPYSITWQTTDEQFFLLAHSLGRDWASRELGLGKYSEEAKKVSTANFTIRSAPVFVPPYLHVKGLVKFVGEGLTPETSTIRFRHVRDEREYQLRVDEIEASYRMRRDSDPAGESTITSTGPLERRVIEYERNWMEKEKETTIRYVRGRRVRSSTPVRDKDGQSRMVPRTQRLRTFVRLDGNLMIHGDSDAAFDIPARSLVRRADLRDDDWTLYVDVAGISGRTRERIWEQLLAVNNTALQQFDDETDTDYQARRELGENRIELTRAALFDVDSAWISLNCRDESQPVRATAGFDVTPDTELQRMLRRVGRAPSRLAPLASDNEVFSLHWGSRIPEPTVEFLRAVATVLQTRYPGADILNLLDETIDDGILELRLSGRANPEHGLACLGALRVSNPSDRDQQALSQLLLLIPELAGQQVVSEQGRSFMRISLSELARAKKELLPEWEFVEVPQYAFFHLRQNVLWFAVGGSNAWKVLDEDLTAVEHKGDQEESTNTGGPQPLMTLRLNLESAVGDEGEKNGLGDYLKHFELAYARWATDLWFEIRNSVSPFKFKPEVPKDFEYDTVYQRALAEKPARAELKIFSVPNGLRGELTLDRSLALLYYGRLALNGLDAHKAQMKAMTVKPKPIPPPPAPGGLLRASRDRN